MITAFVLIVTIAAAIFIFEWSRGLIRSLTPYRKRYYQNKVRSIENMLLDFEFLRAQKLVLREDIRKEFDRMGELVSSLKDKLKDSDMSPKTREVLDKQLEDYTRDHEQLERQLRQLDAEVSNTNKDLPPGLEQQIEQSHEVLKMLKEHMR